MIPYGYHVKILFKNLPFLLNLKRTSLVILYWRLAPVWSYCTGPSGQFSPIVLALQGDPCLHEFQFLTFFDPYWPLGGPKVPKSTFFVIPVQFPSKWGVLTPVCKKNIFDLFWPLLTTRWPKVPKSTFFVIPVQFRSKWVVLTPICQKSHFWPFLTFVDLYWPLGGPKVPKSTLFVIPVQFRSKWGVLTPVCKNSHFWPFLPMLTSTDH